MVERDTDDDTESDREVECETLPERVCDGVRDPVLLAELVELAVVENDQLSVGVTDVVRDLDAEISTVAEIDREMDLLSEEEDEKLCVNESDEDGVLETDDDTEAVLVFFVAERLMEAVVLAEVE